MALLDARDPVALAQALIRCRSVTPDDNGALAVVADALRDAGFCCALKTFDGDGSYPVQNLYARLGSGAPNLCFAGHTDVVPTGPEEAWTAPPFGAEVHAGRLVGRGAVDMKGSIACFMAAALRYVDASDGAMPTGSLSFLITGDEEADAVNGTVKMLRWLQETNETLDACLVGEPSNPTALGEQIKIGRRGSINGRMVVTGKQGHVAYPHLADNPVTKLAQMVAALSGLTIDEATERFERSQLQFTVMDADNSATNMIPASARAGFNVRYNDRWQRPTMEAWLREQIKAQAATVGAAATVTFSGSGDVFLTEPGPLVDTLADAIEAATGRRPELTTGGGTSDARFIKDACPVVEFGLVNATIHEVDEHVPIADLEALTDIYGRFIAKYFAQAAVV